MSVTLHSREDSPLDIYDTAEHEVVVYGCGTVAPGLVHDPCQHSVIQVQCCRCAGCIQEVWSCTATFDRPAWYEPEALAEFADPYLRHPLAVLSYAALTAVGVATQVVETIGHITVVAASAGTLVFGFALTQILH